MTKTENNALTKEQAMELVTQALALGLTAPSKELIRSCSEMAARLATEFKFKRSEMDQCKELALAKVDELLNQSRTVH